MEILMLGDSVNVKDDLNEFHKINFVHYSR